MPRPPPVVYSSADSIPDFPPWATELLRGARPGVTWRRLREQTPWMPWTGRSAERRHCPTSATRAWRGRSLSFERLFARSWFVAGFVQDVPQPGDAMPVEAFGTALLVLRDLDGVIRVFHNVCRYRRAVLVSGKCSGLRELASPNRGWIYELDGSLRGSPHGCHDDAPGLVPVRSQVWHHWIFVNLDGEAPALKDYLAPAADLVRGYNLGASRHAGTVHFEIAANWKLALENYIEPYHVFSAHPRLHAFVPMSERMPSRIDRHVMWNRYLFKTSEPGRGDGLPYFPNLSDEAARQGIWFILPTAFWRRSLSGSRGELSRRARRTGPLPRAHRRLPGR